MLRRLVPTIALAVIGGVLSLPSVRADESAGLHPFTHVAYIPAGADPGTIRFEKVRLVKVPTVLRYSMNSCDQAAFRDPGGSSDCPNALAGAPAPAYEATYSYTGQPVASDQTAGCSFTFSVLFRPEELPTDTQKALAGQRLSRTDAAAYFALSTYTEPISSVAIDSRRSQFCAGTFMDGQWTHADPACQDHIAYQPVTAPSGYLTVKVQPVARRARVTGTSATAPETASKSTTPRPGLGPGR